jgi:hypothetical protein
MLISWISETVHVLADMPALSLYQRPGQAACDALNKKLTLSLSFHVVGPGESAARIGPWCGAAV